MATQKIITNAAASLPRVDSWEDVMALVPFRLFQSEISETAHIMRFHCSMMAIYAKRYVNRLRTEYVGVPGVVPYTPEEICEAEARVSAFLQQCDDFVGAVAKCEEFVSEREAWKKLLVAFFEMHPTWDRWYGLFLQDWYRWKVGGEVEYMADEVPDGEIQGAFATFKKSAA